MTGPHLTVGPLRPLTALIAAAIAVLALLGPASISTAAAPEIAASAQILPNQSDGGTGDNEFLPTDRDLTECISAMPKPGCGSEARGGWRQTAVFLAVLGGLGFIAWRVIASARAAGRAGRPGRAPSPPTPSHPQARRSGADDQSADVPTPPSDR